MHVWKWVERTFHTCWWSYFTYFFVDVKMEKAQQLVGSIEGFDATKLRHTETHEKNPLPDKDGKRIKFLFRFAWVWKTAFAW